MTVSTIDDVKELGVSTLQGTQRFSLVSKNVDHTFIIDVARPPFPARPGQLLPVVFVLDGDSTFGIASQMAVSLQMDPGGLPPVLVVGIGYGSSLGGWRSRDLTPSVDERYLALARRAPPPFALGADINLGGAAAFLSFIKDELTPFLASRFPIDAHDQTVVGMSLGGLFAVHTLFNAPSAFRRYVAASPSLWWDDRVIFREEAALAASARDLAARLFVSVGELEEAADTTARMNSNVEELCQTLRERAYPSLRLTEMVFPGETHMSVYPAAVSRGLRAVFDANANTAEWAKLSQE